MKTEIFDGQALAKEILAEVKKELESLDKKPTLAVVSFGSEQSLYIKRKKEVAEDLGIGFKRYSFDESISAKEFRRRLNEVVKSSQIDSVVVQLPLPKSINSAVLNIIPLEKDPDLLSDRAIGQFFNNRSKILPPTAEAILVILEKSNIKLKDALVVIFGYGKLVGRFLVKMFLEQEAIVRVAAHPLRNELLKDFVAKSDIIISGVGEALFLKANLLPEESVVVDAGFSTLDGKPVGDVNFEAVQDKFRLIIPVPGGVGPVGVAMLFKNIVKLYKNHN